MTQVGVVGAASVVGRALTARLSADENVTRLVGVDVTEPAMPPGRLELRLCDVRDPLLGRHLKGLDVVVHLPSAEPLRHTVATRRDLMVHGTGNVLAAAERSGIGRFVHLSTAMVYGARPDNPVPLREEAPLRADPAFGVAYQALLAEELVAGFAERNPGVAVAVLRPCTVLGAGIDSFVTRHLEGLFLPQVRGSNPVLQVVDVADLAAALALAATRALSGPFNVAGEGWLAAAELYRLLGVRPVRLPEANAFALAARLEGLGLVPVEPAALRFLMEPWVVGTDRLHDHGWAPQTPQRELIRELAVRRRRWLAVGRLRLRRQRLRGLVGIGTGLMALAARRRWRRAPTSGRRQRSRGRPRRLR